MTYLPTLAVLVGIFAPLLVRRFKRNVLKTAEDRRAVHVKGSGQILP